MQSQVNRNSHINNTGNQIQGAQNQILLPPVRRPRLPVQTTNQEVRQINSGENITNRNNMENSRSSTISENSDSTSIYKDKIVLLENRISLLIGENREMRTLLGQNNQDLLDKDHKISLLETELMILKLEMIEIRDKLKSKSKSSSNSRQNQEVQCFSLSQND